MQNNTNWRLSRHFAAGVVLSSSVLLLTSCGNDDETPKDIPVSSSPSTSSTSSNDASSKSSSSIVSSSKASSSTPKGDASSLVIEENAHGFCNVDGVPSESDHEGFTGTGYTNTDNATDKAIEWSVNSANSGSYTLQFRFANGGKEARPGELIVNNGSQGNHTVTLEMMGDWKTWQTETVTVDLAQGTNTLRLVSTSEQGLANIDSLTVIGNGVTAGDCAKLISSSSSMAASSSSSSASPVVIEPGNGEILAQDGNPVHSRYNKYKSEWPISKADIILSHQYDSGGWPKNQNYGSTGKGGNGKGTFDNGATTLEMTFLARAYNETGNEKYRNAVRKAVDYVIEAQYPKGGWPQYYPLRGGYSNHVTFNDDGMSRILTMLHHIVQKTAPYNTDVITDEHRRKAQASIAKGVDYILNAQVIQNGKKSAWCAQHGKDDYKPKLARAYEHPSISGSESIEIIGFLMTQPQTPKVKEAVISAINWFNSPETYLNNYEYSGDKFKPKTGSRVWYRFYDIPTNEPIFSNYDGVIHIGLDKQDKKKTGYRWGGNWGEKIISYGKKVGYL